MNQNRIKIQTLRLHYQRSKQFKIIYLEGIRIKVIWLLPLTSVVVQNDEINLNLCWIFFSVPAKMSTCAAKLKFSCKTRVNIKRLAKAAQQNNLSIHPTNCIWIRCNKWNVFRNIVYLNRKIENQLMTWFSFKVQPNLI